MYVYAWKTIVFRRHVAAGGWSTEKQRKVVLFAIKNNILFREKKYKNNAQILLKYSAKHNIALIVQYKKYA